MTGLTGSAPIVDPDLIVKIALKRIALAHVRSKRSEGGNNTGEGGERVAVFVALAGRGCRVQTGRYSAAALSVSKNVPT